MVDLLKLYEESGYTPTASELPDFLPLFLEYASTRPPHWPSVAAWQRS